MKTLEAKGYAPVREGDRKKTQWLDVTGVAISHRMAKEKAAKHDKEFPYFSEIHPVLRIVKVKITEIKEGGAK